jgi:Zn-dependent protease
MHHNIIFVLKNFVNIRNLLTILIFEVGVADSIELLIVLMHQCNVIFPISISSSIDFLLELQVPNLPLTLFNMFPIGRFDSLNVRSFPSFRSQIMIFVDLNQATII